MKRVLVTGASGFVGRHVLEPLRNRGYEVHAISRAGTSVPASGITWHRANLLDPGEAAQVVAAVRPTHLLHLAWYLEPGKYLASPENLRWIRASLELVEGFVEAGGQRVTAAGTCFEYNLDYGFCSERLTPHAPATLYAVAKAAVHAVLTTFCRQAGVSAAWAHLFFLYGPYEHPDRLVGYVARSLLSGEPARCSHGRQVRDFLHVQDVADALAAVLDSRVEGAVNIGSGQPMALKDIVGRLATKIGRPDLVELGAREVPPGEPPLVVADVRRLAEEVGWHPAYDLERGLDDTVRWWRTALK